MKNLSENTQEMPQSRSTVFSRHQNKDNKNEKKNRKRILTWGKISKSKVRNKEQIVLVEGN